MKKFLPVAGAFLAVYLIWCFITPTFSYQKIKRRVNDLHSQDAFTNDKVKNDQYIYDELFYLAETKGIFPEEMEINIDRLESKRIRSISVYYTDYVLFFGYELIPRNYTYISKLEDRRRSI